ncbi:MAG: glycosyltransferase [bacterium]
MKPGCSIIIVTYHSAKTISTCLASVLNTLRRNDEIIVIDNHSADQTAEILRDFAAASGRKMSLFLQTENLGFARACNIGIEKSNKEFVVLLNPDTEVFGDWLSRLTEHFRFYPKTAAVGPLSNYVIRTQHITSYFPEYADYLNDAAGLMACLNERFKRRSLPSKLLIGFCLMLKRDLIERFGGLDADFFLGMEDLEISWRLREQGYLLRVALDVFVNHVGHVSFNTAPESHSEHFVQKGADVLYEKMHVHYHPEPVPHPEDYFGVGWWQPSILKTKPVTEVFAPKLKPDDYTQLVLQIKSLIKKRSQQAAIRLVRQALKRYVNDYILWYTLGSVYLAVGELAEAEAALKNAWALEGNQDKACKKLNREVNLRRQQETVVL